MKEQGKNDMKYLDTLFTNFPKYFELIFLKDGKREDYLKKDNKCDWKTFKKLEISMKSRDCE